MTLYYIKAAAIMLALFSCIIAAYTDVRYQIIPNKLTFTTAALGLMMGIYYYMNVNSIFIVSYLAGVLAVYIISYLLWRLGLWAGGDVKLFTALSTLLPKDYLTILPVFKIHNLTFPGYLEYVSPIFDLMFNSILSVLPLLLIIITYEILRNKINLVKDLVKSISLIDVLTTFNTIMLFTLIDNMLDVQVIIEFFILITISYLNKKVSQKAQKIETVLAVMMLIITILQKIWMIYILEFITILIIYTTLATIKSGIFSKALRDYVKVEDLTESMVPACNLCYNGKKYYFDKRSLKERLISENTDDIIISTAASGLSAGDVKLISKIYCEGLLSDNHVLIKKTLSFGPFILAGLVITLTIGNTYQMILQLGGMIL